MNHQPQKHDKLTDRGRIRIHTHAQIKHEQLKAEAIDILIDALHRQMGGGATVSFDHNLARKIEKLIIGNMPRTKIIALVRTGIHKPRLLKPPLTGRCWPRGAGSAQALARFATKYHKPRLGHISVLSTPCYGRSLTRIKVSGRRQNMQSHGDDVRMRVLNALHWDFAVPRNRLKVDVEDGRVTLSGIVDLPYQRSCAEFDVRNVPGVVGVVNQVRLTPKDANPLPADRH